MKNWQRLLKVLMGILSVFLVAGMLSGAQADEVAIGGGVVFAPDYEGSSDYMAVPVPFGMAAFDNGMYIRLEGVYLRANLIPRSWTGWLEAGPVYSYRPERSNVDNSQVDNMKSVSDANELGAFVGFAYNGWYTRLEFLADVGNAHEGWYSELNGGYNWILDSSWSMRFSAFATYANDDYMQTYFGVNLLDSATSGLAPFSAGSGLKDVGLQYRLNWKFADHWSTTGLIDYSRLLNDASSDSPVTDVGSANQFIGGLVVLYHF
jgi:outer membrane scaffolding protein for murein synthesis (MipA/OmpV family)